MFIWIGHSPPPSVGGASFFSWFLDDMRNPHTSFLAASPPEYRPACSKLLISSSPLVTLEIGWKGEETDEEK